MASIRVTDLSKAFGSETVFEKITFTLNEGERLGLVGRNGAGKSTLLRCLIGEEEADGGSITVTDQATVGYLRQQIDFGAATIREEIHAAWADVHTLQAELDEVRRRLTRTPHDELLLARYAKLEERFERLGGYEYEAMTRRILHGLGFSEADWDRPATEFSGGQKTRVNLARALVRRPDFLILDEPTNHLDIAMTEWLEDYLRSYRGGILLVSHDRYFLDALTTGILDLSQGHLTQYRGNYTEFTEKKAARMAAARKAYEQQQEEIAATEEYIRRYKAGIKAKQARGRQSRLSRMERLQKPVTETTLAFHFRPATGTAERVITAKELSAKYGEREVFRDVSLLIRQGDTVGIIGPNGIGKSTLLHILAGEAAPAAGTVQIGNRVRLGYYSQEHIRLHNERTVLVEVMYEYGCGEDEARQILGGFLFRGDDVYREVGRLSGGERARLALLLLLLEEPNVLILDEPTNHLDIATREMMEDALLAFGGTYVVVSHDRYLLDRLATRILSFEDGTVREYLGNYSYWKTKRQELLDTGRLQPGEAAETEVPQKPPAERDVPAATNPAAAAPSRTGAPPSTPAGSERLRRKLAELEQEIARSEATVQMYQTQIAAADPSDATVLTELAAALAAEEARLQQHYTAWEAYAEQLE